MIVSDHTFCDDAENTRAVVSPTVSQWVGNTPLLDLSGLIAGRKQVKLLAKAEWNNPGGSVKDRAALRIIQEAESAGHLTRDKILIDASSGNTGVAYAMFGAVLGYKVRIVVPENVNPRIKQVLQIYGAELLYSDPLLGSDGAIIEVRRRVAQTPEAYFYADQYSNDANWMAHYHGTGKEIIRQTKGAVTHFVAGLGTGGTFTGTGRRLKKFNPDTKLTSIQPDSPFHGLEGLKHMKSDIVPAIYDPGLADENLPVATEDAQQMVKKLARRYGLLVGLSSGAALVGALEVCRSIDSGCIVTILPDSANRYFNQEFWNEN